MQSDLFGLYLLVMPSAAFALGYGLHAFHMRRHRHAQAVIARLRRIGGR